MKTESRQMQKIKLAKGKPGKTRVCLCVKVWCVKNITLICVSICLYLVNRGVLSSVGETPRYRNDNCYYAYHHHSMPSVNTVYLPSNQYTYHQRSIPAINTGFDSFSIKYSILT